MAISPTPEPNSTLALHGGSAVISAGPPAWPIRDHDVSAAVESALADGSWGRYHGPHVRQLEQLLGDMHEIPYALTCCSGTFAVELALRGLNVGPNDEVVLAGYDFPGNFRCIEAVGARPVLVDIDPRTWCLDASAVEKAVGPQTRAILASHLHGGIADMEQIRRIADRANLMVVEDACQAPAAQVQGRIAGSWGDVGVLSFGGSKLVSAGRGGAILTGREDVYQRAKIFCERGNHAFPLSELQAATLPPQLHKLAARNARRNESVARLLAATGRLQALRPVATNPAESQPAYYKLAWCYDERQTAISREHFIAMIQAEGVAIDAGFRGFTRRGTRRCRRSGGLINSQQAADSTVLLHHPVLLAGDTAIDLVAAALNKVLTGQTHS